ncbi:MAG: hypothetical protein ABGX42_04305 [Gammaproteobacteria bacterium]
MKQDLGIKIGTPEEAKWTEILEVQKESLLANKINQQIAENMIILCEKRISEEKETFK